MLGPTSVNSLGDAKYVVTGAKGQLGKELCQTLGPSCSGADATELDICDKQVVGDFLRRHNPRVVINCAAYTAVDRAEEEPAAATVLNAELPAYRHWQRPQEHLENADLRYGKQ